MHECIVTKSFHMYGKGRAEPGQKVKLTSADFARFHRLGCVKTTAEVEAEAAAKAESKRIMAEAEEAAAAAREEALRDADARVAKARAEALERRRNADAADPAPQSSIVSEVPEGSRANLADVNVDRGRELISDETNAAVLNAWAKAEVEGKGRKTILDAIASRTAELTLSEGDEDDDVLNADDD